MYFSKSVYYFEISFRVLMFIFDGGSILKINIIFILTFIEIINFFCFIFDIFYFFLFEITTDNFYFFGNKRYDIDIYNK
jgi:hypothetical protein